MKITRLPIAPCILGESPLWSPEEQAFYWVDGLAPALLRLDWASRNVERQPLPEIVGSIARAPGSRIVLAFARHFGLLRFGSDPEVLFTPTTLPDRVRFNDSKCDPAGRLVAGTMDLAEADPVGAAYILGAGNALAEIDRGYTVFNGPCWSGEAFFTSDSAGMRVFRFDYDAATGMASGKTVWLQLNEADGLPDGATFDAAGRYWQARNGGGKLAVHAADSKLIDEIAMPTQNVTSLAFGGPDLTAMLVTSMARLLPWQTELDADAGATFLIEDLDVAGCAEPLFRLAG
jgi:sugar lactone lactonase YvrE